MDDPNEKQTKEKKKRGKCIKLKGLPPTQQPRDILPEVVKEGLQPSPDTKKYLDC